MQAGPEISPVQFSFVIFNINRCFVYILFPFQYCSSNLEWVAATLQINLAFMDEFMHESVEVNTF